MSDPHKNQTYKLAALDLPAPAKRVLPPLRAEEVAEPAADKSPNVSKQQAGKDTPKDLGIPLFF